MLINALIAFVAFKVMMQYDAAQFPSLLPSLAEAVDLTLPVGIWLLPASAAGWLIARRSMRETEMSGLQRHAIAGAAAGFGASFQIVFFVGFIGPALLGPIVGAFVASAIYLLRMRLRKPA